MPILRARTTGPTAGSSGDDLWDRLDASPHLFAVESPPHRSGVVVCTRPSVEPGEELTLVAAGDTTATLGVVRIDGTAPGGRVPVWSRPRVRLGTSLSDVASTAVTRRWGSGLFLAGARPDGGGPTSWHPFVVTDWAVDSPVVVQVPTFTYQAYNACGGASLYPFNSPSGSAEVVSLRRPFDVFDGAGFAFYGDIPFAWWLSTTGIDALWVTSEQTHARPDLLDGRRLFVSVFHDEYWTPQMRDHLESAIARGVNAAFLGANSMYWQVEIGGDPLVMRCAKGPAGPQSRFRDVGRPEAALLGSQYGHFRFPYGLAAADWVVSGASHWLYEGTGLVGGDHISRLVGYEWDRLPGDAPGPGVEVVADSPVGDGQRHHACVVTHAGGATVVNAGTTYWPRLLAGGGLWQPDARVQTMTRNIVRRLGGR